MAVSLVSTGIQFPDATIQTTAGGAGIISNYQQFLSSGTWTKPSGCTWLYIEAIGGGGSGVGGAGTSPGGGGGMFNYVLILASTVTSTVTVTIGAGGASSSTTPGNDGGNSTFGSYLTAYGGGGGIGTVGGFAGGISSPAYSWGNTTVVIPFAGFHAGSGGGQYVGGGVSAPGKSIKGGGGGSSVNGGYAGGTSIDGGAGGAASTAGTVPGGGGGGSAGASGAGAAGRIRVWAW